MIIVRPLEGENELLAIMQAADVSYLVPIRLCFDSACVDLAPFPCLASALMNGRLLRLCCGIAGAGHAEWRLHVHWHHRDGNRWCAFSIRPSLICFQSDLIVLLVVDRLAGNIPREQRDKLLNGFFSLRYACVPDLPWLQRRSSCTVSRC